MYRVGDKLIVPDEKVQYHIEKLNDSKDKRVVYKIYVDEEHGENNIRLITLYARSKPRAKKELPGQFTAFEFLDPARVRMYTWDDVQCKVAIAPGVITVYDHDENTVDQDVDVSGWAGEDVIEQPVLLGEGDALAGDDLAIDRNVANHFIDPDHEEIVSCGDIDADDAMPSLVMLRMACICVLARGDQIVGKPRTRLVQPFELVFLRPEIGIR